MTYKELEDSDDVQELREVCSATCLMICEAVFEIITGNAGLDPTDICIASRQNKMLEVFFSAERDAAQILTHLQESVVTGAVMQQCNALAGTLMELMRDSALWPPLSTTNCFQTALSDDDDTYGMMPEEEFPSAVNAASVYRYVRTHMRGWFPVYYTEAYIEAVLEYVEANAFPHSGSLSIWLRMFKQHFGCIACKRKFAYHASKLLRRRYLPLSNLPCSDRNGSRRKINQEKKLFPVQQRQETSQKRIPARAVEMPATLCHLSHGEIPGRSTRMIDKVK